MPSDTHSSATPKQDLIGESAPFLETLEKVSRIAPLDRPVLVVGERGTGKELVAERLHFLSGRWDGPLVKLNCAAISPALLESELFGHEAGAFTDASRRRLGRFERADGGTLFLDELATSSAEVQEKVLRVIEYGEFERLGSSETRHVDVRLVSATNHDLEDLIQEGGFRSDLFFRIRGMQIHLPALRERRDDIPLLVQHYATQYAEQMNKPGLTVAEDAMLAMQQFDWPGNVRQLINAVQNAVIVCEGDKLEPRHLPAGVAQGGDSSGTGSVETAGLSLDQLEKQAIRNALQVTAGNREKAAKMLGIGERTLYRKLNEYGLK